MLAATEAQVPLNPAVPAAGTVGAVGFDLNESRQFGTRNLVKDRDYRVARTAVDGPRGRVAVQAMTPLKPLHDEMQALQLLMLVLLPLGSLSEPLMEFGDCISHF
mgnify:CR=1 FL=1